MATVRLRYIFAQRITAHTLSSALTVKIFRNLRNAGKAWFYDGTTACQPELPHASRKGDIMSANKRKIKRQITPKSPQGGVL